MRPVSRLRLLVETEIESHLVGSFACLNKPAGEYILPLSVLLEAEMMRAIADIPDGLLVRSGEHEAANPGADREHGDRLSGPPGQCSYIQSMEH